MHRLLRFAIAVLWLIATVKGNEDGTAAKEIDGNWYLNKVNAIRYDNVNGTATYSSIVAMNTDGTCSSVPKTVGGSLSPFNEEVCAAPNIKPKCACADTASIVIHSLPRASSSQAACDLHCLSYNQFQA